MMKSIWHNSWFTIPVLLFFAAGLSLLLFVPYGDEILHLNTLREEPLNSFFRFCTRFGEPPAYFAAALAALFWRFRFVVLIALTGLVTIPLVYTMKDKVGADRPITYFEKQGIRDAVVLVPGVPLNGGQTSFPSGHTMAAFGLFGMLTLATTRRTSMLGFAFAWTAILVAVSRIFLVQHFLVDVLGGAFLGISIASLFWAFDRQYLARFRFLDGSLLRKI